MSAAFTVRVDETTLVALDGIAAKTERSRDWLVNRAIEDFVALSGWQFEKIEAGLAAADQGDFASEAEIERIRDKFTPRR